MLCGYHGAAVFEVFVSYRIMLISTEFSKHKFQCLQDTQLLITRLWLTVVVETTYAIVIFAC